MKRVKKIVFVILSIILGLILLFSVYNFISLKVLHKDLASINGYALLEVVSGSMEPTILKGDMIVINTKNKNYKENDIITFRGKEGEFVTHRIMSIDEDMMITKGDNNNTEDDPISTKSIVGKYVTKINGGGRILSSFKNPFTMVMIFVIGLLGCILLSTDSDGKPILDQDEKEFQEFLKSKNEKESNIKKVKEKKVLKNSSKPKKENSKANTNSKDTKETKGSNVKKASKAKATKNSKTNSSKASTTEKASKKKEEPKKVVTTKKQVVEPKKATKVSTTKKAIPKKEVAKKSTSKNTANKTNTTKNKTTTTKSSKK